VCAAPPDQSASDREGTSAGQASGHREQLSVPEAAAVEPTPEVVGKADRRLDEHRAAHQQAEHREHHAGDG
jgi:hypothetical protein